MQAKQRLNGVAEDTAINYLTNSNSNENYSGKCERKFGYKVENNSRFSNKQIQKQMNAIREEMKDKRYV